MLVRLLPLVALALLWLPSQAGPHPRPPANPTLVTGWHDEFDKLDDWAPWTGGNHDILRGAVGHLTVVLGRSSMYMSVFKHYRSGVYRDIEVDLDHYPVVAVRADHVKNIFQWDVQVLQYRQEKAKDARDISKDGGVPVPGNPRGLAAYIVAESKLHRGPGIVFATIAPKPADIGKSASA